MKRQNVRRALILIMFILLPVIFLYFSPAIPFFGAMEGIVSGSMVVFSVLLVASLFWGRAFCGWLCPVGGMQECCTSASNKNTKGGKLNLIKYFIWVPWLTSILILAVLAGGFKRIDFTYCTTGGISLLNTQAYIVYYVCLSIVLILALAGGKRAFCHYVCWAAPFMVLGSKLKSRMKYPSLKLSADREKCTDCGLCNKKCPMSINVKEMIKRDPVEDSECILCGECIDSCPKKVIKYSL
ncbi:MAG: 4Fe-4S binding protein [Clostridia bacterium]|nr:4Fe-4S binding protein [Clostridia bacterium]